LNRFALQGSFARAFAAGLSNKQKKTKALPEGPVLSKGGSAVILIYRDILPARAGNPQQIKP